MIKKILSILLCISMIFSFAAVAEARSAGSFSVEDKIEILKALGMINEEYDDLTIDNSKTLSRAEYAYFAACAFENGITDNSLYFHDLPRENWASGYVSVLVEAGLIGVNPKKYFYPEEEMTFEEAYRISLKALGYGPVLDSMNVFSLAQSVGISEGVEATGILNFHNAVTIIYNTLFTEVMEYRGSVYARSDESYLENKYSIVFEQGILECVDGVSVTAEYENDNTYISGKEFESSDINIYELLGCEIVYLYEYNKKEDSEKIIWAKKARENDEELKLMYTENEVSFDSSSYELSYYDGKKYKRIKLDKDIDVVYNGEYVVSGIEKVLTEEFYYLKLIERNGDYSCIIISDYENYNVGGIDSVEECIYDMTSGKVLSLRQNDKLTIRDVNGKSFEFKDIKAGNVLTVYKSLSGERTEVIVSDSRAEGIVTAISEDEAGCQTFEVNGKAYRKANPDDREIILIGSKVVLYLDAYGYISMIESAGDSDILAYLINPYYDDSDEKLFVKIYDRSGKILRLECAGKLKINSEIYKSTSAALGELNNYGTGLMVYKKNEEGLVSNIRFAVNDGTSGLRLRFPKESLRYRSTGSRLGQKMCLDNNTIIFGIPDDVKNATEEDFVVTTRASLFGDMNYMVESYAVSENVGYEQILLVYGNDWNYKHGNTTGILVTGISKKLSDGEVLDCIEGWQGAQKVEKLLDEELSAAEEGIEKGDYITFEENTMGRVVNISVKYDLSEGRRPKSKDMHMIEAISSGYVNEVNGNVATVGIESGADFDMAYDFASGAVLIYDTEHNEVTQGTVKDLISYEVAGEDCDFLLTHMRYSKQLVYIVYR